MRWPHSRQDRATAGPRAIPVVGAAEAPTEAGVGRTVVMARPFLIFPAGAGRMWHLLSIGLARAYAVTRKVIIDSGCRGFIGPCPSAPLDEWVVDVVVRTS